MERSPPQGGRSGTRGKGTPPSRPPQRGGGLSRLPARLPRRHRPCGRRQLGLCYPQFDQLGRKTRPSAGVLAVQKARSILGRSYYGVHHPSQGTLPKACDQVGRDGWYREAKSTHVVVIARHASPALGWVGHGTLPRVLRGRTHGTPRRSSDRNARKETRCAPADHQPCQNS